MADEALMENAKKVYDTVCEALDNRNWKYTKEEENLIIRYTVTGDDLPMDFVFYVNSNRQLLQLFSPMLFRMSENRRVEGAVITSAVNSKIADGSFDYGMSDGKITFRLTASYIDCEISEGVVQYMISCAANTVDDYNDKFLAVSKGYISLDDFIEGK